MASASLAVWPRRLPIGRRTRLLAQRIRLGRDLLRSTRREAGAVPAPSDAPFLTVGLASWRGRENTPGRGALSQPEPGTARAAGGSRLRPDAGS